MSRQRRNFSAKFKSDLVIELLKGEKDLNTLATENNIQPNLLRNWKKEFLNNASVVFDDKREDNLKEKLAEERKEKAEYDQKVGQLTMQVDWLKKNLKKFVDLTTRVSLVQNLLTTKEIPASIGAKLLDINRTSIYYKGTPVSEEELACKEIIDHLHTDNPTWVQDKCLHSWKPWLSTSVSQGETLHEWDGHLFNLSKDESFQTDAAGKSMSLSSS